MYKVLNLKKNKRSKKMFLKPTAKVGQSALLLISVAGTSDSAKSSSRSMT